MRAGRVSHTDDTSLQFLPWRNPSRVVRETEHQQGERPWQKKELSRSYRPGIPLPVLFSRTRCRFNRGRPLRRVPSKRSRSIGKDGEKNIEVRYDIDDVAVGGLSLFPLRRQPGLRHSAGIENMIEFG